MPADSFQARVTARHVAREQVAVRFRQHAYTCDHPPELGGEDLGPTPSEFLLAALACSIAQHVGRHAARLKIPLDSVEIRADFQVGQEKGRPPLDPMAYLSRVTARVDIQGDMTREQFEKLKYIAENCVVAHSFRRGIAPEIEVAMPSSGRPR